MRRKQWMTLAIGIGGLGGLLLTQQTAWTGSFGTPIADRLLTVVHGTAKDPILMTSAGPEEASLMERIINSGMPPVEQERLRKLAVTPGVYSLNPEGVFEDVVAAPQIVQFEDPVTGEAMEIELFPVESNGKTQYVVRPDALPLFSNPADSDHAVLERNSALFLLDGRNLKITFLGDPEARRSQLSRAADLQLKASTEAADDQENNSHALSWAVGPHWSQDGRHIAFLTNRDTLGKHYGTSIWVHELATGRDRVVLRGQTGRPIVVRGWTPNNELIVENFRSDSGELQQPVLMAVGLDGSRRRLTPGRFVAQTPEASTLISLRQRGQHAELLALDLESGKQQVIWNESSDGLRLRSIKIAFHTNGRRLVTDLEDSRNVQSLLVYDLRTGKRRILPVRTGWQLALPPAWVGDRILLPLERNGAVQTLVITPDMK